MTQNLEQLKVGQLIGSQKLKLSCDLKTFPREIYTLADTLEILDLSGNQLTQLPDDFDCLKKLKILFLSDNFFTEFPNILSRCLNLEIIGFKANQISLIQENSFPPKLRWLILTNNRLSLLPKAIGKCVRMQKLMLAGNSLKSLPEEMANCKNLQLLRISANEIEELPLWLLSLPQLSWLAFAGNPCSVSNKNSKFHEIYWNELSVKHQLGEGASGIIYNAEWIDMSNHDVAVKLFKGEVTSDGLPKDEMNAAILVGTHPNLVKVLGIIVGHPMRKQGLVLELIPKVYKNLGGPPSFETCTRDTFEAELTFSIQEAMQIISDISSVAIHIHTRGLMHGDLYAHNILIDKTTSHLLFGDFGAATAYELESSLASSLERIEVRAFGCLMEDILTHVNSNDRHFEIFSRLTDLKTNCLKEEVLKRPDFVEVRKMITDMQK